MQPRVITESIKCECGCSSVILDSIAGDNDAIVFASLSFVRDGTKSALLYQRLADMFRTLFMGGYTPVDIVLTRDGAERLRNSLDHALDHWVKKL